MRARQRIRTWGLVIAAGAAAACDSRPAPRRSLLAARAAAAPTPAAALGPIDHAPELAVDAACSDSLESAALRCAEGAAMRHGDSLTIMLSDGGTVTHVDNHSETDQAISFAYAGRIGGASGTPVFHLLDVVGVHAYVVQLINARTGDSAYTVGHPLLSPDGARFAAVVNGIGDACEGITSVEIWRVTGDVPVRELSLEPWDCDKQTGWGPEQIEWVSRDTLDVLRSAPARGGARRAAGGVDTSHVRFVRGATGWTLDPRTR